MPSPTFVLLPTGYAREDAREPWTVIDRHNVEVGRYTFGGAFDAAKTLNSELGDERYQPYTVAWAGTDQRNAVDRRRSA